jgi:hypothetical protein
VRGRGLGERGRKSQRDIEREGGRERNSETERERERARERERERERPCERGGGQRVRRSSSTRLILVYDTLLISLLHFT